MARVLDLNNVTVLRDKKPVLNNVDWQVDSDQRWVIIGPNGAGKTTLLRVAAAQIQPSSGKAIVLGQTLGQVNVFELRTRIGFASNALSSHIPNSETVLNSVMTASYAITGRWNEEYDDVDVRRALRVLNEWQLSELAERAFGTLSDGERKRAQIARSVMPDPELLLLDEPVASLDVKLRLYPQERVLEKLGLSAGLGYGRVRTETRGTATIRWDRLTLPHVTRNALCQPPRFPWRRSISGCLARIGQPPWRLAAV